jgi:hypothetical protein
MSKSEINRRKFFKRGLTGLGIALSGQLFLKEDVFVTETSRDLDEYLVLSNEKSLKFKSTEDIFRGLIMCESSTF